MKIAALSCLLGLASLAMASPSIPLNITWDENPTFGQAKEWVDSENSGLQKRQDGGVMICTDINWGGTCGYAKQPWDLCIQLTDPWWHSISSIGPDDYNVIVAYTDFNCGSSSQLAIFNPGYSDLRTAGWNDQIGSFRVRQIPGPACFNEIDTSRIPDSNCNDCCNGCNRSGNGCCPDGAFC